VTQRVGGSPKRGRTRVVEARHGADPLAVEGEDVESDAVVDAVRAARR
jgi:hypothetical protein